MVAFNDLPTDIMVENNTLILEREDSLDGHILLLAN